MPNLTRRAERAVLGALLRDPGLLPDLRHLRLDDFASARHAEIFTAIQEARDARSGGSGSSFVAAVALAARSGGAGIEELDDIARACPQPSHGAVYARMVQEASLRRTWPPPPNACIRKPRTCTTTNAASGRPRDQATARTSSPRISSGWLARC
jgi:replicative DNA helicase